LRYVLFYINEKYITSMLHDLLVDIKLDKLTCYPNVETTAIESACAEIEVAQLQEILKKYTAAEYLHDTDENIKVMVDMGKAVDAPETADDVLNTLRDKEPLYYRCLVEVFKAWVKKTTKTPAASEILPEAQEEPKNASETLPEAQEEPNPNAVVS
jgi:hypothetical protein